jgi:hypothetical protein
VFDADVDIITQLLKKLVGPEPLDERVCITIYNAGSFGCAICMPLS